MENNHLRVGTLLKDDSYRIDAVLGVGGFGVTYRAVQVLLGKTVAIKEFFMGDFCVRNNDGFGVSVGVDNNIPLVSGFKRKFLREARMVAKLQNRHIVDIYDVFEENGTAYYVMEYLTGGSIEELVSASGAIPEQKALELVRQVGDALSYVHGNKILHLDVKPANIMLRANGDAVLIDFGISKQYDENNANKSSVATALSCAYAPLEQFEAGGVSDFQPTLDVYSFAATVYYMISGIEPPRALAILQEGIIAVPNASATVSDAIIAAMNPIRVNRTGSIAEFLSMLSIAVPDVKDSECTRTSHPVSGSGTDVVKEKEVQYIYETDSQNSTGVKKKSKVWLVVLLSVLFVALASAATYFAIEYLDSKSTKKSKRERVVSESEESMGEAEDQPVDTYDEIPADIVEDSVVGIVQESADTVDLEPVVENDAPAAPVAQASVVHNAVTDYAAMAASGIDLCSRGNYAAALPMLKTAAEHNVASAQNALGECYQRGQGVGIDYSAAVSWYTRAADKGNADAQYNLAVCYSRGLGVGRNPERAALFFECAANQGHMMAQYNIAECYRNGSGVEINYAKAKEWYRKAAAQGYAPAEDKLRLIRN